MLSPETGRYFKKFNLILGAFHGIQAIIILIISSDYSIPITTTFLKYNETAQKLGVETIVAFDVQISWFVAIFFFLSMEAHVLVATLLNHQYNLDLEQGINRIRWIEYSLSASVMMVGISMLVGIYDIVALAAIFSLMCITNLCGLVMELVNLPRKNTVMWSPFLIGCFPGAVPWAIVFYQFAISSFHDSNPPDFVYAVFIVMGIFFNLFPINMVLIYKKKYWWKDYTFAEKTWCYLSLFSKSPVAWIVFGGTFRP
jgi:hypothetical protein